MSEKPVASIKTLARYEPDIVYIGTGEYVAECVRADDGDYYLAADVDAEIEALRAEVYELRAARIAYASEFPETKDGGPDTGNIHANIRSLKARAERLAEALREARDAIEDWAGYASDYFREKHDLAGDLAKIDALLRDQEEGHEQ